MTVVITGVLLHLVMMVVIAGDVLGVGGGSCVLTFDMLQLIVIVW